MRLTVTDPPSVTVPTTSEFNLVTVLNLVNTGGTTVPTAITPISALTVPFAAISTVIPAPTPFSAQPTLTSIRLNSSSSSMGGTLIVSSISKPWEISSKTTSKRPPASSKMSPIWRAVCGERRARREGVEMGLEAKPGRLRPWIAKPTEPALDGCALVMNARLWPRWGLLMGVELGRRGKEEGGGLTC